MQIQSFSTYIKSNKVTFFWDTWYTSGGGGGAEYTFSDSSLQSISRHKNSNTIGCMGEILQRTIHQICRDGAKFAQNATPSTFLGGILHNFVTRVVIIMSYYVRPSYIQ